MALSISTTLNLVPAFTWTESPARPSLWLLSTRRPTASLALTRRVKFSASMSTSKPLSHTFLPFLTTPSLHSSWRVEGTFQERMIYTSSNTSSCSRVVNIVKQRRLLPILQGYVFPYCFAFSFLCLSWSGYSAHGASHRIVQDSSSASWWSLAHLAVLRHPSWERRAKPSWVCWTRPSSLTTREEAAPGEVAQGEQGMKLSLI